MPRERPRSSHLRYVQLAKTSTKAHTCPSCGADAIVVVWAQFDGEDVIPDGLLTVRSCSADAGHPLVGL
jgi:hypothetical protein